MRIRFGRWDFAPTLWPTLAALFFLVLTLWLGNWQSERADAKRALQQRYDHALQSPPIHLGGERLDPDSVFYRQVEVQGTFDDAHTILLDNRVHAGVAGYHVLTPLRIADSQFAVLVNRGWIATGARRDQLPAATAPRGVVKLRGLAIDPHTRYFELMHEPAPGRVWQNLDMDRFAARYATPLQAFLLLQTSPADDGLIRDWPRPDTGVSMHVSYAIQWYSLAVTLVVLWSVLNLKRRRRDGSHGPASEPKKNV